MFRSPVTDLNDLQQEVDSSDARKDSNGNGVRDDDAGGDDSDTDGNNVGESEEDTGEKQKGSLTISDSKNITYACTVFIKLLFICCTMVGTQHRCIQ